jgi:hypothetical protein
MDMVMAGNVQPCAKENTVKEDTSKLDEDFKRVAEKITAANDALREAAAIAKEHGHLNDISSFLGSKLYMTDYDDLRNTLEETGLITQNEYDGSRGWYSSEKCW